MSTISHSSEQAGPPDNSCTCCKRSTAKPQLDLPDSTQSVPYYVRGLALGLPAIMLGVQITAWIFFIPMARAGHADFRAFYAAGYMVRTGRSAELYSYDAERSTQNQLVSTEPVGMPFIHPAYEALLFAPISLFGYRTAYLAFLGLNVALIVVAYCFLRPQLPALAAIERWLPAATFFLFLPVAGTLMQGQDSVLLLALLCATAMLLNSGRDLSAGVFAGLGLFRLQLVLPIAFLFALWRKWRFIAGFALAGMAAGAISVMLVGVAQTRTYVHTITSLSGAGSIADQIRYGQPDWQMANLRGLVASIYGPHLPVHLTRILILSLSLMLVLYIGKRAQRFQAVKLLAIAIVTSALVSYQFLFHDMSVLLIPTLLALNGSLPAVGKHDRGSSVLAGAATLIFVSPVLISFAPTRYYLVSLVVCIFLVALLGCAPTRTGSLGRAFSNLDAP